MTNGRNFPMNHPGGKPSHYQRLTETACRQRGARGFDKTLSVTQLGARGLVAWILDKGFVGRELGRREREDTAVGREGCAVI